LDTEQDIFQVAPEDILRYDLFQGSFSKQLVLDLLSELTADNVCLSLVSQVHAEDPAFEAKVSAACSSLARAMHLLDNRHRIYYAFGTADRDRGVVWRQVLARRRER